MHSGTDPMVHLIEVKNKSDPYFPLGGMRGGSFFSETIHRVLQVTRFITSECFFQHVKERFRLKQSFVQSCVQA